MKQTYLNELDTEFSAIPRLKLVAQGMPDMIGSEDRVANWLHSVTM